MKRKIKKVINEIKHNKEFYTLVIGGLAITYICVRFDNYRIYKSCHKAMRDVLENWEDIYEC